MSEPEIARRCSACGVTLRQHALFCPQCGQKTGETEARDTLVTRDMRDTQIIEAQNRDTRDTQIIEPPNRDTRDTQILEPPERNVQVYEDPSLTRPALTGVADNVRDRVEKIKHVSSVMIDQAAYDPSLRFLLVAAALFVVFLVVLLLSKVIG